MGSSIGALLVTLSLSVGQASAEIEQEERDFQNQAHQQWWGRDIVWKFDELPTEGKVTEKRVPYSGSIYPDTSGGTMSALRKYDMAFNAGSLLATEHERRDISATETTTRQVIERFGFFGSQYRTYTIQVNATPSWYGHCNGWTSAAIRHAEPQKEVTRNGVVFTPADIKGLLAEVYMYNDPQMLAGDGTRINPGVFHAVLANWLGNGKHPIGMEADPGKEKWNYPIYGYAMQQSRHSREFVEVGMNVTFAQSSRGEFQQSPRIPSSKYFHYRLQLDDDGAIVGGQYYSDSSQIDMLWVPLRLKPSGKEGNERGNPYIDVDEVLAIWRKSVPDELLSSWVIIDPPNRTPVITVAKEASVVENQSRALKVTAEDEDLLQPLSFVAAQQLEYSIDGGPDRNAFTIDAETGDLLFVETPDFESPADADKDNLYQVKVAVSDGAGESTSKLLSIRVTDANDAPVIISDRAFTTLENRVSAIAIDFRDQDQPKETLVCSITGGPDQKIFTIDSMTGKLTFRQSPDFEQPADADNDNNYEIEVSVMDSEDQAATQLINVAVRDANDVPTIASQSKLQAAENQLAVIKIDSKDEDFPKQPLLCSLSGGMDREQFTINSVTGELKFSQMPDFERPTDANGDNVYEVEVSVADNAGGTAKQLVTVTLTNSNDSPVITTSNKPSVQENQLVALNVGFHDEDLPKQAVTCSLIGGDDLTMFDIDPINGEVKFKAMPDFEHPADADKDNIYEVALLVKDDAGAATAQLLNISVTDANDAPIIVSSPKLTTAEQRTTISKIAAIDEDTSNQRLRFSVAGGADRSKFTIDNKTGELGFKREPDFEHPSDKNKDNLYEVEVQVTDDSGAIARQMLSVAVTDANDFPVITSDDRSTLPEGELVALTVIAQDEDKQPQTLTFSLRGGADRNRFEIDPTSGELTFQQAPDFEQPTDTNGDNVYEVKVQVDDGAGGTSSQQVHVAVQDTNDAPVIRSPNVAEASENQLAALTIVAEDQDAPRQQLTCVLVGGSDREQFTIDSATGELTFKQLPDFEQPNDADHDNSYEVEVKVEDSKGAVATQLVNIRVTNVNERPIITYSPKVYENLKDVLTVNVTDEDMSMQEMTISLSAGADRKLFSIDSKTGDLAFRLAPDFENPIDADKDNVYEVEVKVDDGQGGIAVQSIRVKVVDVEEMPVQVVAKGADLAVSEEPKPDSEQPAVDPQ